MDGGVDQQTLVFHEQADGRKVSRLPEGKVVLIHFDHLDRVQDGETWLVQLEHRDTYAVATPLERLKKAEPREAPPLVEETKEPARPTQTAREPDPRTHPRRFIRPEDRVALFVDGANMDGACRDAGFFLDYGKVIKTFLGDGRFYAAFYYTADFNDDMQTRFLDYLSYVGYVVRKKPVKVIVDQETGDKRYKGNVDTELVLDMVNTVDNYDVALLFSGDSDYERAIDLLRARGKRVYVISSSGTLSRELALISDKPVFLLEDLQALVQRDRSDR